MLVPITVAALARRVFTPCAARCWYRWFDSSYWRNGSWLFCALRHVELFSLRDLRGLGQVLGVARMYKSSDLGLESRGKHVEKVLVKYLSSYLVFGGVGLERQGSNTQNLDSCEELCYSFLGSLLGPHQLTPSLLRRAFGVKALL